MATSDFDRPPFRDDGFDLVFVQSVLHHNGTPAWAIREALRVAQPVLIAALIGRTPDTCRMLRFITAALTVNLQVASCYTLEAWGS
jgi:ubiquinone/menaquinone biosynthesis C-methylase UbiE